MPIVHEAQRQVLISKIPQADYATPTDPTTPANFVQLEVMDKNVTNLQAAVSDNAEDAHGIDWATQEFLESWDAEASHDLAVSSEQIGRLLLLLFGQVTTTQPDATHMPTVYQHVFTPQDANVSRQLPVATVAEIIGTALNRSYPSMAMESLSLKGDGMKRISSSFQMSGSGRQTVPSGLSVSQAVALMSTGLHYFFNSQATGTISDAGTFANATNYGTSRLFNSWEFGWANNLIKDDAYRPGAGQFQDNADPTSGAVRSESLFGLRVPSGSMVTRLMSQSDQLAALRARKEMDWKLELTGAVIGTYLSTTYNHKLTIQAPRLKYDMVDLGSSNGLYTQQIRPKFLYDPSVGRIITATLINTIPSYVV